MYNRQNKALASHPENHRLVLKLCKSSNELKKSLNVQHFREEVAAIHSAWELCHLLYDGRPLLP